MANNKIKFILNTSGKIFFFPFSFTRTNFVLLSLSAFYFKLLLSTTSKAAAAAAAAAATAMDTG